VRHWGVVCVSGSIIYLLLFFLVKGDMNKMLEFQLHDTYFVIGILHASVYVVVVLYCILAFLYQFIARWKSHVLNVTQIGFTTVLLSVYYLLWIFGRQYFKGLFENSPKQSGWTIYPPLSAVSQEMPEPTIPWMSWLAITLLIVLPIVYLVYCIYRTVKNYRISRT
jgi:heme/copper-type cytochrome/quinol oxidase subunit 1